MNTISSLLKNLRNRTPVGTIEMFAGTTAPTDWLVCNGAAVSRETFEALFREIGTTYGEGDGSTTFNLPDLRDRMPIGAGSSYTLNAKGGSPYIQAHTHGFTQPSVTGGSCTIGASGEHGHVVRVARLFTSGTNKNGAESNGTTTGTGLIQTSGAHTHTVPAHTHYVSGGAVGVVSGATTGNAGNMPPYIGINFIIYAGTTAES